MIPGRELDLLVAKKVMGYKGEIRCPGPILTDIPQGCHKDKPVIASDGDLHFLRKYSTDISAAWEVVEKMKEEYKWKVQISLIPKTVYKSAEYSCAFVKHFPSSQSFYGSGQSAPHAICLAALKAKGVTNG